MAWIAEDKFYVVTDPDGLVIRERGSDVSIFFDRSHSYHDVLNVCHDENAKHLVAKGLFKTEEDYHKYRRWSPMDNGDYRMPDEIRKLYLK